MIRTARNDDLNRIAEIEVFNYRLKFYPIFLDDEFYFGELQVPNVARRYADLLEDIRVWEMGGRTSLKEYSLFLSNTISEMLLTLP